MTESGIWTVLPNGFDEDRGLLRATLFFSPRLPNRCRSITPHMPRSRSAPRRRGSCS